MNSELMEKRTYQLPKLVLKLDIERIEKKIDLLTDINLLILTSLHLVYHYIIKLKKTKLLLSQDLSTI